MVQSVRSYLLTVRIQGLHLVNSSISTLHTVAVSDQLLHYNDILDDNISSNAV